MTTYQRIRRLIHPDGYGFFLDPDGAFTLIASVLVSLTVLLTSELPSLVVNDAVDALTRLEGAPLFGLVAAFAVGGSYLTRTIIRSTPPRNFRHTLHFHGWIALAGLTTTLVCVLGWSWAHPAGLLLQAASGTLIVASGLVAIRHVMTIRARQLREQQDAESPSLHEAH